MDEGHQLSMVVQIRCCIYRVGNAISNGYVGDSKAKDEVPHGLRLAWIGSRVVVQKRRI